MTKSIRPKAKTPQPSEDPLAYFRPSAPKLAPVPRLTALEEMYAYF